MFSARCAEMGESGFAPTRRITNRFWVYIWRCTKRILLDHAVVGAFPTMPEKMKKKNKQVLLGGRSGLCPYRNN